jgi:hypothetical protein
MLIATMADQKAKGRAVASIAPPRLPVTSPVIHPLTTRYRAKPDMPAQMRRSTGFLSDLIIERP